MIIDAVFFCVLWREGKALHGNGTIMALGRTAICEGGICLRQKRSSFRARGVVVLVHTQHRILVRILA